MIEPDEIDAERKLAWIAEPGLRLPAGTWHVRADAVLFEQACSWATAVSSSVFVVSNSAIMVSIHHHQSLIESKWHFTTLCFLGEVAHAMFRACVLLTL
jgi:hypothetical protein